MQPKCGFGNNNNNKWNWNDRSCWFSQQKWCVANKTWNSWHPRFGESIQNWDPSADPLSDWRKTSYLRSSADVSQQWDVKTKKWFRKKVADGVLDAKKNPQKKWKNLTGFHQWLINWWVFGTTNYRKTSSESTIGGIESVGARLS